MDNYEPGRGYRFVGKRLVGEGTFRLVKPIRPFGEEQDSNEPSNQSVVAVEI